MLLEDNETELERLATSPRNGYEDVTAYSVSSCLKLEMTELYDALKIAL